MSDPVVIAGAGPAGLTAALALIRAGRDVTILERDESVGGLARTVERNGFRFDLGGHRFFTRVTEMEALWKELLGPDLLVRQRRSRILFHGHFYDYPLTAGSALRGLGPMEAARIVASYLSARLRPRTPEASFADWVVNRFGRRLFETFFRPYTEKVWGVPCESIGADSGRSPPSSSILASARGCSGSGCATRCSGAAAGSCSVTASPACGSGRPGSRQWRRRGRKAAPCSRRRT
jgi:protoporphyrinogen oxidase